MTDVEKYLENTTPTQKAFYEKVKKIVKAQIPEAEESLTYGIPTFKYKGKYVIYFGAFKTHMSIYPIFAETVKEIGPELEKFRAGKGTLRFTEENPIPEKFITALVKYRRDSLNKV